MSREIVRDHGVMMLLGSMRAEERLAAFLLNHVAALHGAGLFVVRIPPAHDPRRIGSYLGLKLETVSARLSRFQEDGLVAVQQKHIRILDTRVSSVSCSSPRP